MKKVELNKVLEEIDLHIKSFKEIIEQAKDGSVDKETLNLLEQKIWKIKRERMNLKHEWSEHFEIWMQATRAVEKLTGFKPGTPEYESAVEKTFEVMHFQHMLRKMEAGDE